MWLRLVGRMASSSWQQVVLHRDWGRATHATLRFKFVCNKVNIQTNWVKSFHVPFDWGL